MRKVLSLRDFFFLIGVMKFQESNNELRDMRNIDIVTRLHRDDLVGNKWYLVYNVYLSIYTTPASNR